MKKLLVFLIAVTMVAGFSTVSFADAEGAGISASGSPHNFTDNLVGDVSVPDFEIDGTKTGWNEREEICRVCHVPHDHGRSTAYWTNGLLWNHAVDSTTTTFTMYDSVSMDATAPSAPTGISKLCLGCHDGVEAIDTFDRFAGGSVNFGDTGGYEAGFVIPNTTNGAGDFSGTHPLSIDYTEAKATDDELNATTHSLGSGGTIADFLEGGTILQCSTCHDVHDSATEVVAGTHLLRAATRPGSALCLECHIK